MSKLERDTLIKEFLPDGLPSRLYKYHSINTNLHQSLKGNYFWHAGRTSFNDPYDCYKHLLTFSPTEEQLIEYARRTLLPGEKLDQTTNFILKNPRLVPEAYLSTIDSVLDSQGICCLTTNYRNTLMWSHYANHHKGVCLGFETHRDLDSFFVAKVRYTDDFVPRNYFEDYEHSAMIMLTTKSKDWEYEQEYRLVNERQGAIPFGKAALTEVIFGCKVTQDDMLSVINTVETSGYKDVQYTQAYTLPNSFKLAFRDSPWLTS